MTFSDDDKSWLIENIGNIVAGATTAMARDIALMQADLAELKGDVGELKGDVRELKGDVRDIRHFTALLSRDMMVTKDQGAKTEERLTALEAGVAQLKTLIESGGD